MEVHEKDALKMCYLAILSNNSFLTTLCAINICFNTDSALAS